MQLWKLLFLTSAKSNEICQHAECAILPNSAYHLYQIECEADNGTDGEARKLFKDRMAGSMVRELQNILKC